MSVGLGNLIRAATQMKLPNADKATVQRRKIVDYLLNPAHPVGGSKAHFFLRFGFNAIHWQQLAEALLRHACENEVTTTEVTPHGRRFAVEGPLITPDGSRLNIRSAWYISPGDSAPRFVTALPLRK